MEGRWRHGKPHGRIVMAFPNGFRDECEYRAGQRVPAGPVEGRWSADTIDPARLRFVGGAHDGKTLAAVRGELRAAGVDVDEAAANEALARALNSCEAQGGPLMAVRHGPGGPVAEELELIAAAE